ncbi:MAG: hypothetical protein SGJ10_13920 [Bacteroidota bacterium]|nr:hypothetical protein [Bacteroidota bacterium]
MKKVACIIIILHCTINLYAGHPEKNAFQYSISGCYGLNLLWLIEGRKTWPLGPVIITCEARKGKTGTVLEVNYSENHYINYNRGHIYTYEGNSWFKTETRRTHTILYRARVMAGMNRYFCHSKQNELYAGFRIGYYYMKEKYQYTFDEPVRKIAVDNPSNSVGISIFDWIGYQRICGRICVRVIIP